MSKQNQSEESKDRTELPIERGFPIERVNEIAERENQGGARQYYRPTYSMHKWWARRAGSVFRAISLYTLLDDPENLESFKPGGNSGLDEFGDKSPDRNQLIDRVDHSDPEALWPLYKTDTRIKDKKVLDPFMGGGTGVGEASRFGADVIGTDLNPVAWFVSKKEMEAHSAEVELIETEYEKIKQELEDEIKKYYRRTCPNNPEHDTDVMYYLWVRELDCTSCDNTVQLFKDYRVGKGRYENKGKYHVLCPECWSISLTDDWQSESECDECGHIYVPKDGNVTRGGSYICSDCGQKYKTSDAASEQGGYETQLYGVEYYCEHCDEDGLPKNEFKSYDEVTEEDRIKFQDACEEWENSPSLHQYVPDVDIEPGWKTSSSDFSGSAPGAGDLSQHCIGKWTDMYNERQLLCLAKLIKRIGEIENQDVKEYLLLAFSETLKRNTMMGSYNSAHNGVDHIFKTNSFDPPQQPAEGNIWGLKHGAGPFWRMYDKVVDGIEYAKQPTERFYEGEEMVESEPFNQPLGETAEVFCDDARNLKFENEFDAVITDPPYYDNVMYSELSDFFYVWLRILLKESYEEFESAAAPREEIVANPAQNMGDEEFESELRSAFDQIKTALKPDGALAFTYHHSDADSWGELLTALCDVGFEVTATYPVAADLQRITKGESVSFDIIAVARPIEERTPISWNSLRRRIVRTAKETREILEENRELSSGDIGVIEMGKCFQEYSKHHGEVRRAGDTMSAKDVVDEIYGIIQEGERGEQDVYLDLLEEWNPSYSDLNKHLKRSDASEETIKEMQLFRMDSGEFVLSDWNDERRQAYVQSKVEEGNGDLTNLDKAHFLRYRYEHDRSRDEYLGQWDTDELQELCEDIAAVTGDETYLKMLGVDTTLAEISDE